MESKAAVSALAALAQDSRLAVFRLLVQNGPEGLTAGVIGEQLGLPAPTLSFHLKTLAQAGLVGAVQEGRFVRYRAEMAAIQHPGRLPDRKLLWRRSQPLPPQGVIHD